MKIKKCPFCNSRGELSSDYAEVMDIFVKCDKCGATGPTIVCYTSPEEIPEKLGIKAAQAWNERILK